MSKVVFGDVVKRANTKEDRFNTDKIYYVGGEHIASNEVLVEQRGLIEGSTIGPMFYFGFKAGDVLFVSRNPHLRKAGMVLFDGICSEKTFVLETKDEQILLQKYLPFVLQSDQFWSYMESHKSGSVNFFINWSTLAKYEFELPSLERQRELSDVLWAAVEMKRSYKNLILETDALVKSQFIEMFENKGYDIIRAGTVMRDMRNGLSPSTSGTCHGKVLTLTAFTQGTFDNTQWKEATFAETPPESKRISKSDFYMCRGNGNVKLVGRGVYAYHSNENLVFPDTVIAASIDTEKICLPYLFMAWQMPDVREQIEKGARTTNGTYKINQKIISDIALILPPLSEQHKFEKMLQQADQSKFAIRQSLSRLETLKKALMQQYFG